MPSKTDIPIAAGTKPSSAMVTLIPWDPESPEQVERMYYQRVACGWSEGMIEEWGEQQKQGEKAFHWVVLSDTDPAKEAKLLQHITEYPNEKSQISDTAKSLGGKSRIPSGLDFIPVGHITLDSHNPDPSLADAVRGIYHIAGFYISGALQSTGLGRATMDVLEKMASEQPLCAKVLTLRTMAKQSAFDPLRLKALGKTPAKIVNEEWYQRRGYEIYETVERTWLQKDNEGKEWPAAAVLMRKTIV